MTEHWVEHWGHTFWNTGDTRSGTLGTHVLEHWGHTFMGPKSSGTYVVICTGTLLPDFFRDYPNIRLTQSFVRVHLSTIQCAPLLIPNLSLSRSSPHG